MKKLITIFLLLFPSISFAQENTVQQKVEITIGKLIVENLALSVKIETLNKEIAELKKKLEDKK